VLLGVHGGQLHAVVRGAGRARGCLAHLCDDTGSNRLRLLLQNEAVGAMGHRCGRKHGCVAPDPLHDHLPVQTALLDRLLLRDHPDFYLHYLRHEAHLEEAEPGRLRARRPYALH